MQHKCRIWSLEWNCSQCEIIALLEGVVLSEMVTAKTFGDANETELLKPPKSSCWCRCFTFCWGDCWRASFQKIFFNLWAKGIIPQQTGQGNSSIWFALALPCTKARQSCLHKTTAKLHCFQTHRHLFRTTESDVRPYPVVINQDTQDQECIARPGGGGRLAYPPDDAGLRRMVHLLQKKKKVQPKKCAVIF